MEGEQKPAVQPSWRNRRRMMWAGFVLSWLIIFWILWYDMQSSVAETAVVMAFLNITGTIGSFVFGAVWQDVSIKR